jgi:hypothetical protein
MGRRGHLQDLRQGHSEGARIFDHGCVHVLTSRGCRCKVPGLFSSSRTRTPGSSSTRPTRWLGSSTRRDSICRRIHTMVTQANVRVRDAVSVRASYVVHELGRRALRAEIPLRAFPRAQGRRFSRQLAVPTRGAFAADAAAAIGTFWAEGLTRPRGGAVGLLHPCTTWVQ